MKLVKIWLRKQCNSLIKTCAIALLILSLGISSCSSGPDQDYRRSTLPQGNAITDPEAILRYALPIKNETIREIQQNLEDISNWILGKRWSSVSRDVKQAATVLRFRGDKILESIPEKRLPQAKALIADFDKGIGQLEEAVKATDSDAIISRQSELLAMVTKLEELMVVGFPFEVPDEYANLAQLKGRAVVEMATEKGDLTMVVDGYSAPVTAGNFVDLVKRGFYDDLEFIRAEDKYILQTGDPSGPEQGFIDPNTGKYRAIPLEILVTSEPEPIYGFTLEDIGLYREQPALPFSAYGTLGMARPEAPNGGSSQFFFFLFEPELTPAGLNLLDGRYAVFGYTVKGQKVLEKLKAGDKIISAKVVDGLENLVEPKV